MTAMTLTLAFSSDWHTGTGEGVPGYIDALALRDKDGLPYVRAKSLTGVLRSAAETVAAVLDAVQSAPGAADYWQGVTASLLGARPARHGGQQRHQAVPAKLAIRQAVLPAALAAECKKDAELLAAMFSLRPGVSISDATGRAEDDKLYFVEHVMGGLVLSAPLALRADATPLTDDEAALLVAACSAVRSLGGRRRRGAGALKLDLSGLRPPPAGHGDWLVWLEARISGARTATDALDGGAEQAGPAEQGSEPPVSESPAGGTPAQATEWQVAGLRCVARSPLCLHHATVGNVVESLDYIPGTLLLAEVAKRLGAALKPVDRHLVPLAIANGELQVRPFYPEVAERAAAPTPLSAMWPKDQARPGAQNAVLRHLQPAEGGVQYRAAKAGWVQDGVAAMAERLKPDQLLGLHTHNTIEPQLQRPSAAVGGVYSYEAIAPGTALRGTVAVSGALARALPKDWQGQLTGTTAIGRSSKDDYGEIALNAVEAPGDAQGVECQEGDEFTLFLHSDVLVADAAGAFSGSPLDLLYTLAEALDKWDAKSKPHRLSLVTESGPTGRIHAYALARRLDSWQSAWGLPRPSLVAVRAGSLFRVRLDQGGLSKEASLAVARCGLGARTAEGYGQVEFNPAWLSGKQQLPEAVAGADTSTAGRGGSPPPVPELDKVSKEVLESVETVRWKKAILGAALDHVARGAGRDGDGAWLGIALHAWRKRTSSQLGALRAAALGLARPDGAAEFAMCLERLGAKASWPPAMVDHLRSLAVPQSAAGAPARAPIWDHLGLVIPAPYSTTLASYAAMIATDAVCAQAQWDIGQDCKGKTANEVEQ